MTSSDSRPLIRFAAIVTLLWCTAAVTFAQTAKPEAATTTFFARNWTRVESWRFFEPRPGGGEPDYTFVANRLQAGVRHTRPRWEVTGALQYVQFGGLPERAIGPGALGTGALYFDASQDTNSNQVYLKTLNLRLTPTPGFTVAIGRLPYATGSESPSGVPAIETVKRQRLDSRLIGEFEWSIYQRAFDGVRVDVDRSAWHLTTSFLMPTQGGFEESANVTMTDIRIVAANLGVKPAALGRRTDLQIFALYYDDERDVRARPDNTGLAPSRVEIGLTTMGTSLVGVYPTAGGELDVLGLAALQRGDWYGQDHAAYAVALEAGHRWPAVPWAPWLRAGVNYSSGDDDPSDDDHGTFFQVMPTARKYAFSVAYTQMNLRDVFAQVILRPHSRVTARLDVHRLDLADAADRWYAGSGATAKRGTFFGYAGRPSSGQSGLGAVIEAAADVTLTRYSSINGYVGTMSGGDVVRSLFAGHRLTFFYLEHVLSF
jgi:hypothetical protein